MSRNDAGSEKQGLQNNDSSESNKIFFRVKLRDVAASAWTEENLQTLKKEWGADLNYSRKPLPNLLITQNSGYRKDNSETKPQVRSSPHILEQPDLQHQKSAALSGNRQIEGIDPDKCGPLTKQLWKTLEKLPDDTYNCNFAVKCFIDKSKLNEIQERAKALEENRIERNPLMEQLRAFSMSAQDCLRDTTGCLDPINHILQEHGYNPMPSARLFNNGFRAGDIITLNNHDDQHSAIISEVSTTGRIKRIEQKYDNTSPPISTNVEGFRFIYMKYNGKPVDEAESHLSVWRKLP